MAPVSYMLDGRQWVVVPSGVTMTAFALPRPGRSAGDLRPMDREGERNQIRERIVSHTGKMPAVSFADRAARGSFLLMLPPLFTAGLPIGDGNIKRFLAGPPV